MLAPPSPLRAVPPPCSASAASPPPARSRSPSHRWLPCAPAPEEQGTIRVRTREHQSEAHPSIHPKHRISLRALRLSPHPEFHGSGIEAQSGGGSGGECANLLLADGLLGYPLELIEHLAVLRVANTRGASGSGTQRRSENRNHHHCLPFDPTPPHPPHSARVPPAEPAARHQLHLAEPARAPCAPPPGSLLCFPRRRVPAQA